MREYRCEAAKETPPGFAEPTGALEGITKRSAETLSGCRADFKSRRVSARKASAVCADGFPLPAEHDELTPWDRFVAEGPAAENYLVPRLCRATSAATPRLTVRDLSKIKRYVSRKGLSDRQAAALIGACADAFGPEAWRRA